MVKWENSWYGLLQAFADALKLLLKEYVSPTQANIFLFFLGPIITLIFSLLGYAVIPYGPGIMLLDYNLGILYLLAMSSLATYGILIAGWSANSKYAFLGALRSTAQLISYELILSSAILILVLLAGSLDISVIIEAQRACWYIIPLFPIFIVFFIGSVAETNRAPFDLAEANYLKQKNTAFASIFTTAYLFLKITIFTLIRNICNYTLNIYVILNSIYFYYGLQSALKIWGNTFKAVMSRQFSSTISNNKLHPR